VENVVGEADPTPDSYLRVRRIDVVDESGECRLRFEGGEIQVIGSIELLDERGLVFGELGATYDRAWLTLGRPGGAQVRMASHPDEADLILSSGLGPGPAGADEDGTAQATLHVRSAWSERDEASPASAGLTLDFAGGAVEGRRVVVERTPSDDVLPA